MWSQPGLPQSLSKSRQSTSHPFQVEDGGHLRKSGKLVTDSPGGDCGEIGYEGPQLLVKLQTAKLWGEGSTGNSANGPRCYARYAMNKYQGERGRSLSRRAPVRPFIAG